MAPTYLSDCLPTTIGETVTYNLRNNDDYRTQRCRRIMLVLNLEKVGRYFTLSGKEFHNFTVEGKKDLEIVCRRHL
jgi:hypothetical protein